jgi:hypothetical protein
MKTSHQFVLTVIAIAVSNQFSSGAEPSLPDALKEAQIRALTTGDLVALKPFSDLAEPLRITASWTVLAARQFASAKATLSRESAVLTSEFIFYGASRFVAEGSPKDGRDTAEHNLQKFIAAEIALGAKESPERPKIGEAIFNAVRSSLCPLWPFCR